ncbi:MAG: hypothetical protein AB1552_10630 [Nitrospirota bacterium]
MNHQRFFILIFLSSIYFSLLLPSEASAQMTILYPKRFYLKGLIELSYKDFFTSYTTGDKEFKSTLSYFEQNYRLDGGGYIYHPRLAVFTATVLYNDFRQLAGYSDDTWKSHFIGYDFSLTFLPYRPISLDIFGRKLNHTLDPAGVIVTADRDFHWTEYNYGARLRISRFRNFPLIRLEYNHLYQDLLQFERASGKIESETYTLDVRGSLEFLNTSYQIFAQYTDFSSPATSYKGRYVRINTRTSIIKRFDFYNFFSYTDIDYLSLLSFTSNLFIRERKIFDQYYTYSYTQYKYNFPGLKLQGVTATDIKKDIHTVNGTWGYRFTNRLRSSLSLNYGLRKENNRKANFYGISASLSYGRPFWGFDFSPRYNIRYKDDEDSGYSLQNAVELILTTRKLKFGVWYTNYSFLLINEKQIYFTSLEGDFFGDEETLEKRETKIDRISHSLRTGIRGRGIGRRLSRAQWTIEGELLFSKADIERDRRISAFDDEFDPELPKKEKITLETTRYSVTGTISYPVGWATITAHSGFFAGETNSRSLRRFFFEETIQYPLFRNLIILIKFKETWDKIENNPTKRTDQIELNTEYRIGKLIFTLESRLMKTDYGKRESYQRRLFLKLRRII